LVKHQKTLATALSASLPSETTLKVELDDDLMETFNKVAGSSIQIQLVILQVQTNRTLSKILTELQSGAEEATE
jgi:hypothetical protein